MKRSIQLLTLLAGVLISTTAMAQADLGFKGIGGAVGFVSPENVNGTFSFGAFADLGSIAPKFKLEPRVDFWSHSEENFGAKASINDLAVGARVKYMIEVQNPRLQPYVGSGLALHFLHVSATTPAFGGFPEMTVSDSQTKLGLDLGGGVMTPINMRTNLMGEAWYGIVSDVSQFSLRVGISHSM